VPLHGDDFTQPASDDLPMLNPSVPEKFDYLLRRLTDDGIRFGIMQGYPSTLLFPT
jgi:hypothetical protein